MSVIKITLIDQLTPTLKKSIFNAIRQSGVYQTDELFEEDELMQLESFVFQSIAEDYQFELQFISDGKCLKVSSDFLNDEDKIVEFENEIKTILADSRIKTLIEKKITLNKLTLVLHQFKIVISAQSNWYKLIAGIITTASLATGFRGIKFLDISAPLIIVGIGIVIGLIFLGWILRNSKEVNKQISSNSQKEAKRIFDKLKDY